MVIQFTLSTKIGLVLLGMGLYFVISNLVSFDLDINYYLFLGCIQILIGGYIIDRGNSL